MHSPQESIIIDLILDKHRVVHFPLGIRGFDSVKDFSLIVNEGEAPLIWLEAVAFDNLAFVGVDPFLIYQNYYPEIFEKELAFLDINKVEDMFIMCLANTRSGKHTGITINLAVPLIINWNMRIGKQTVLKNHGELPWEFPINQKNLLTVG